MFKSLKEWLNIPLQIHPCITTDGAGDKSFGADVNTECYAEGKITVVVNTAGTEVVSHTTLYIDATDAIGYLDEVTFQGNRYPIQSICDYFQEGASDIKVVYI